MAVTINNAEIRNLQVGPTIITDGLVSFWTAASRLSYPRTGSIWYDMKIANRNNGSLINMSGTNFTEDAQGALVFDGTDEYMSVPSDSSLNFDNGPFTVSTWVNVSYDLGTGENYLIGKRGMGLLTDYAGWQFRTYRPSGLDTTWTLRGSLDDGSSGSYTSIINLDLNRWYMLTMTYDIYLNRIILYKNNIAAATIYFVPTLGSISNSVPVELCGTQYLNHIDISNPTNLTKASIGSVVLYNKTLTAEEINEQFLATKGRFEI